MTTVIIQIALFDIVFSIDSVVTAVGMAEHLEVMIAAVVIAMIVMMLAANTVARFVEERPTVKMLALSFLLLIGMALIADALHFHIPRAYLYFAVAFSGGVELLNQLVARRRKRTREAAQPVKDPAD
jgi:predicted tellurium resistance membrane protein TerC